jgi:hypothetical protein
MTTTTRTYADIVDSIWNVIKTGDPTKVAEELIAAQKAFQAEKTDGRFSVDSILKEEGVTPKFYAAVMHEYRIAEEKKRAV